MNSENGIKDYFTICNSIKELNSKIMFVGVINERGRLVAGGMNDEIKSMINRKFYEVLFMQVTLKVKMRKEFDKQLGSVNFTMSQRDRTLAIAFPIGVSDTLCVFAESNVEYSKLIKRIQSLRGKK